MQLWKVEQWVLHSKEVDLPIDILHEVNQREFHLGFGCELNIMQEGFAILHNLLIDVGINTEYLLLLGSLDQNLTDLLLLDLICWG